jgi:hypothetical protein
MRTLDGSLAVKSLVILLFAIVSSANASQHFGDKVPDVKPVSLAKAVSKTSKESVAIVGVVKKVCEKKGCWMTLESGGKSARVTFKDYGFFVPTSLMDRKVVVYGQLTVHEMSVKEAQHFAQDAGQSKEKIASIKTPQKELRFVASGVRPL